jgi:hypothetical protein
MEYKGIQIFEDPRQGSVRRVQGISREWQIRHLPLDSLDMKMDIDKALWNILTSNGEYLADFINFRESIADYQTIMLATTLTLSEVQALENELSGKEWGELLQRCKEAIGGEVEDFFDGSPSDTGSKQHRTKPTTRAAQKSMN